MIVRRLALVLALTLAPGFASAESDVDRHGDPLPQGALARLGTVRFRSGGPLVLARFLGERHILTLNAERRVEIWDRDTGRVERSFEAKCGRPELNLSSISSSGNTAAFSEDGRRLAILAPDRRILVWDVTTGRLMRTITLDEYVNNITISADGRRLAVLGGDMSVQLYDTDGEDEPRRIGGEPDRASFIGYRFMFSQNGASLLLAGLDFRNQLTPMVRRWDVLRGGDVQLVPLPKQLNSSVLSRCVISSDGKQLAAVEANALTVYELTEGQQVHRIVAPGFDIATRLSFAPNGQSIAAASGPGDLFRVWSLEDGREIARIGEEPQGLRLGSVSTRQQSAMSLSSDGNVLLVPTDSTLRLVDLKKPQPMVDDAGHRAAIRFAMFDAGGRTVLTAGSDFTLRRWSASTGEPLGKADVLPRTMAFAASPDGRWLAIHERGGGTRVIDLATARSQFTAEPVGTSGQTLLFSPDSTILAIAGRNTANVLLYDVPSGHRRAELRLPEPAPPLSSIRPNIVVNRIVYRRLYFSGDGRTLGVLAGNHLSLWNCDTGRMIHTVDFDLTVSPVNMALAPDGRTAAIETAAGRVSVWELATGRPRFYLDQANRLVPSMLTRTSTDAAGQSNTLVFSADGRWLAHASADHSIRIWDVTGAAEVHSLTGHFGQPLALHFSADGRRLLSAGADATGLVWSIPERQPKLGSDLKPLNENRLVEAWEALLLDDAEHAWLAMRTLAADCKRSVPFLRERLQPMAPPPEAELGKLIAELCEPRFEIRRRAARELGRYGELALPVLEQTAATHESAEARAAARRLLEQVGQTPTMGEKLREMRAVQVLELAGTSEALSLLRELAEGADVSIPTLQARGALARLATP